VSCRADFHPAPGNYDPRTPGNVLDQTVASGGTAALSLLSSVKCLIKMRRISNRVTAVPTMRDTITVFYNPDDPSKSTLALESSRFEGWGKVVFTTALCLFFGAAYLLCPGHDAVRSVGHE
jgi:hypothetical protein